ncbi:MAG TPA: alkaline phosphatase D family protein [Tepidisphaeraceae bacterium]|nr:alkaline phosphatase D family protein [Tepidisphaeraceae bacterium]
MTRPGRISRRKFLGAAAGASAAASSLSCGPHGLFGIFRSFRPTILGGVGSGDVTHDAAIVRSAANRPGRMTVEWATVESLKDATQVVGPDAVSRTGFTAQVDLTGLPADTRVFYRVRFESLDDFSMSEPVTGSFRTAPAPGTPPARDVTIVWSGDTAGQGWGIDPARGGMPIYAAMTALDPDLFIHSGDTIYADVPIPETVALPDGSAWKNIVMPAKSKPAQSLAEFRANHAYNLLADGVRTFNARVPIIAQWDDHEVRNNWFPGQRIDDPRYDERDADVLAARARQAFMEYMPIRPGATDPGRIYRNYAYGPLVEVFVVDERSYRGPNSPNRQTSLGRAAEFLGPPQLEWLKRALAASTATWKVIASDMPMSCVAKDGKTDYEAWANGEPGAPLGRELELANLLSFIKQTRVRNVVFVTADVHFAANLHYHPDRATAFKAFDPFWEFISGPLHAGGFGPSQLDKTFGPEYRWKSTPAKQGIGPGHGYGHFGMIRVDATSRVMSVTQHDIAGREIARQEIEPVA